MNRSYEGDIDITNNELEVFKLYARKTSSYFVNKVFPNLNIDEILKKDTINLVKKLALLQNANHAWKKINNRDFLKSLSLILVDPQTNKEGITLAGILLFGKENIIMSVLPHYKTDAIFRIKNKDRYDDRDVISVNLIESYYRLMDFGKKHLNDIFVLDDDQRRINARDIILREIISNTLAHRDYSNGFSAKFIIDDEKILVENSNIQHGMGILNLNNLIPFSKNPTIAKVFREIGFAEELGFGTRNVFKCTKLYSNKEPIFERGRYF